MSELSTTTVVDERTVPGIKEAALLVKNDPEARADFQAVQRYRRRMAERHAGQAAGWIRQMFPTAHLVILDRDTGDEDEALRPLSIRDRDGKLLWFNYGYAAGFVGTDEWIEAEGYDRTTWPVIETTTFDELTDKILTADEWIPEGYYPGTLDPDRYPEQRFGGELTHFYVEEEIAKQRRLAEPGRTPLIVVDTGLLHEWLADPKSAAAEHLHEQWAPDEDLAADLFRCLADEWVLGQATLRATWQAPRVEAMFTNTLRGGYIVFGADIVGGRRIASLPQSYEQLADSQGRTGIEAALELLLYAARQLNDAFPSQH